jgi:glycosyltransferase involved in cell wall biosynthesis
LSWFFPHTFQNQDSLVEPPVNPYISIVIPNHNSAKTIGLCLDSVYASTYTDYEVIVIDDCSTDDSIAVIERYPCRLFRLTEHGGASKARNTGAENSSGKIIFFIDADCLLQANTLTTAVSAYQEEGPTVVLGGTYTWQPYDRDFFSRFQSIYIHYSETKNNSNPDYIATHAMLISAELFRKSGGFNEKFLPILEDVEFSHRLKRLGFSLRMKPDIQVRHIFNFSFLRSMRNGIKKSKYWSLYSIKNKDLLTDSGTASQEFKFNVLSCYITVFLLLTAFLLRQWLFFLPILPLFGTNIYLNRNLIGAFYRISGPLFAFSALLYYTFVYPFAVGIGVSSGIFSQHFELRS